MLKIARLIKSLLQKLLLICVTDLAAILYFVGKPFLQKKKNAVATRCFTLFNRQL